MDLSPNVGQQPDENTYAGPSAAEADGVILPVLDDAEQHGRCELSCQWASRTVADSSVRNEA